MSLENKIKVDWNCPEFIYAKDVRLAVDELRKRGLANRKKMQEENPELFIPDILIENGYNALCCISLQDIDEVFGFKED